VIAHSEAYPAGTGGFGADAGWVALGAVGPGQRHADVGFVDAVAALEGVVQRFLEVGECLVQTLRVSETLRVFWTSELAIRGEQKGLTHLEYEDGSLSNEDTGQPTSGDLILKGEGGPPVLVEAMLEGPFQLQKAN
jgi:hypothetical protein